MACFYELFIPLSQHRQASVLNKVLIQSNVCTYKPHKYSFYDNILSIANSTELFSLHIVGGVRAQSHSLHSASKEKPCSRDQKLAWWPFGQNHNHNFIYYKTRCKNKHLPLTSYSLCCTCGKLNLLMNQLSWLITVCSLAFKNIAFDQSALICSGTAMAKVCR